MTSLYQRFVLSGFVVCFCVCFTTGQHGYKKKSVALSHSFGQVLCPALGCKRSFNLPEQVIFEQKVGKSV